jgi:TetR/AcrR family acrAB operon transcriptional repressor
MARKTREAALATREALIDAAERVFRREGVTGTTLAEVAAEAGVTRGAIYWHFRDKGELFGAMCERTMMPLDAALACAAQTAQTDPLGALRALALDAFGRLSSDPRAHAVFEIMFHKCEQVGDIVHAATTAVPDRHACLSHVEKLIVQAVRAGQLPSDTDTLLAAHMMNAYVVGVMHQWVRDPAAYDLRRAGQAVIDTFITGLRASPPRSSTMAGAGERATAASAD